MKPKEKVNIHMQTQIKNTECMEGGKQRGEGGGKGGKGDKEEKENEEKRDREINLIREE